MTDVPSSGDPPPAHAGPPQPPPIAPQPTRQPQPSPSDELIAEFRRKAGPIVAQARGLTPAARVKLADLARQIGLGEDRIDDALRTLAESPATAAPAPRSKEAEKFYRRLLKDLGGSGKAIIGPTHEATIVAAGKEKYGLDEATALDLLAEAAAELGLQRIRGDEATRNLATAVEDALGDQTWIATDARDRLYSAGKNWGLSQDVVDELIDERLAANSVAAAQASKRNRLVFGMTTAGVVVALSTIIFLVLRGGGSKPPPEPTPAPVAASVEKPATVVQPKWWSVDMVLAVGEARKAINDFGDFYPELASDSATRRAAAYRALVSRVERVPPDPKHLAAAGKLLAAAYAREPDDKAAAAIAEKLLSHLPTSDSPLPKHSAAYDLAYWAAETALAAAAEPDASSDRSAQLADMLALRTNVRFDPSVALTNQTHTLLGGLSSTLLRHLTSHGAKSPTTVASLAPYVSQRAEKHLDQTALDRLHAELLLATVPAADPTTVPRFRELVAQLASADDPQTVLSMVDLYERMDSSPLRDELRNLLVLRLNVSSPSQSPRALARSMRQALGVARSGSQGIESRWYSLRSRAEETLERPPSRRAAPDEQLVQAVELAWLGTQALALAQGEAGMPVFDELAAMYPDEPFSLKKPEEEEDGASVSLPAPIVTGSSLSNSELQALGRFLNQLSDPTTSQVQRESALRGLAQLAPRHSDLKIDQARKLATYLLLRKDEAEHRLAVETVGSLRHWKQLRLALADLLATIKEQSNEVAALVWALGGRSDEGIDPGVLRIALLESVVRDLSAVNDSRSAADIGRSQPSYEAATAALVDIYRIRARLLGVSPAEYQSASSPAQVLSVAVRHMAAQAPSEMSGAAARSFATATGWPRPLVDRWPKELATIDYLATGDLNRAALLSDLAAQLSAAKLVAERPTRREAALALLGDQWEVARTSAPNSAAEQLRQNEAHLLKMWLLLAPDEV